MYQRPTASAAHVTWRVAVFVCVLMAGSCGDSTQLAAQVQSEVSVEFLPSNVSFSTTGNDIQTMLVLRNPTSEELVVSKIDFFSNPLSEELKKELKPVLSAPEIVLQKSERAWPIPLPKSMADRAPVKLYASLSYHIAKEQAEQSQLRVRSRIATLDILRHPPETAESIASASFVTPVEKLKIGQTLDLYVSVSNKSAANIAVLPIKCLNCDSFLIQDDRGPKGTKIAPRVTTSFPLKLTVHSRVVPAMESLSLNIELNWGTAPKVSSGVLVLTKEVTLGNFHEPEEVSTPMYLSRLILPGFLIFVGFLAIWSQKLNRTMFDSWKQAFSPMFLVLAIALSWLIKLPFWLRKVDFEWLSIYINKYGRDDIINDWQLFIVVGVVVAIVARSVSALIYWLYWLCSKAPSEKDDAFETLVKLGRREQKLFLPSIDIETDSGKKRVFQIEDKQNWVAEEIVVDGVRSKHKPEAANFERLLESRIATAKTMAELLELGQTKHKWTIRWKVGEPLVRFKRFKFDPKYVDSIVSRGD